MEFLFLVISVCGFAAVLVVLHRIHTELKNMAENLDFYFKRHVSMTVSQQMRKLRD